MKKGIIYTALTAAALTAVNHILFARARRRLAAPAASCFFDGRYGRVHYTVCGQGAPLLLIHGVGPGRSGREWEAAAGLLAAHRQVYTLDLPGFGESDTPALDYSAYLYTVLINDFIHKVICQKTDVIAAGHGAAYAVMACAFAPKPFGRLLLVSPEGLDAPAARDALRDGLVKRLLYAPLLGTTALNLLQSRLALKRYWEGNVHCPSAVTRSWLTQCHDQTHAKGAAARYVLGAYGCGLLDTDIRRVLTQIKNPIRVIWGEYDTGHRSAPAGGAAVETAVVAGAKRLPHWENPHAFCRICRRLLQG